MANGFVELLPVKLVPFVSLTQAPVLYELTSRSFEGITMIGMTFLFLLMKQLMKSKPLWQTVSGWLLPVANLIFQDMFSGSARSSSACADEGLKTGSPIDLRTGFDLHTQEGQKKAWQQIIEQEPTTVLMAPFCRPWCKWSSMVPEHTRNAQRKAALPMVEFCVKVALYQISKGRYFIIENP